MEQNTKYLPPAATNIAELRLDILYPNILYATLINHTPVENSAMRDVNDMWQQRVYKKVNSVKILLY